MCDKCGREAGRKSFYFVLRTRPSARRNAKTQSHEFIRSNIALPKSYCRL
ncbi:hypothetical protein [Campylobacter troglodytis]|nr:hypothetical protein [Campylobacter troglodytis]